MSARPSGRVSSWLVRELDIKQLHCVQDSLRRKKPGTPPPAEDEDAWQWFMDEYDPLLVHWVKRLHLGPDEQDCLQEIRLEAIKKLPGFVSDGSQHGFCSWLRKLAHAKAVDFLRKKKRLASRSLDACPEGILVSPRPGPLAEFERKRLQDVVQRVLRRLAQTLNPLTFRIFSLHYIERNTIPNIAVMQDLSQRQVRCHLTSAREILRTLAEEDPERDYLLDSGSASSLHSDILLKRGVHSSLANDYIIKATCGEHLTRRGLTCQPVAALVPSGVEVIPRPAR